MCSVICPLIWQLSNVRLAVNVFTLLQRIKVLLKDYLNYYCYRDSPYPLISIKLCYRIHHDSGCRGTMHYLRKRMQQLLLDSRISYTIKDRIIFEWIYLRQNMSQKFHKYVSTAFKDYNILYSFMSIVYLCIIYLFR